MEQSIDPFLEQARMEENTHSLNNNQNYDIYSFIHEERGDERLRLLVFRIGHFCRELTLAQN